MYHIDVCLVCLMDVQVYCLLTNISSGASDYSLQNWVLNVAQNGTFVKSPNMNNWPTGVHGIPA